MIKNTSSIPRITKNYIINLWPVARRMGRAKRNPSNLFHNLLYLNFFIITLDWCKLDLQIKQQKYYNILINIKTKNQ
ncbi:hypothetical protein TI03_03260 [Achromatium sp. WMS1]|nr:hypothetical protein TI03_03260 [Achromatium sp. WMS1]